MKSDHSASQAISKVLIGGCGQLGKEIVDVMLSRHLFAAENITALVRTQYSQGLCSVKGIETIAIDLDETD